MNCINGDPLNDSDISSILDGIASVESVHHIEECQFCANLVQQAGLTDTKLKQMLNRWDCPPALELAEYHANLLEHTTSAETIKNHLTVCKRCQDELGTLTQFLQDSEPDKENSFETRVSRPHQQSFSGIIRLSIGVDEPDRVLRGRTSGPIMASAADGTTAFVEVETELGNHTLTGQIVIEDMDSWDNAQVMVFQEDLMVAMTLVGELCDFTCRIKDTSPITLRIYNSQGQTILLEDVQWSD